MAIPNKAAAESHVSSGTFRGAMLKISRAADHIKDLGQAVAVFVDENPCHILTKSEPQSGNLLLSLRFDAQIPDAFGLIAGDAIHNLRAALDHLMWELIGLDGGVQNSYLHFPTSGNRQDYEARINGISHTQRTDTKDFLRGLEVYPGGKGQRLHALHILDVGDKHTVLTPLVSAARVSKITILQPNGRIAGTMTDCGGTIGKDGYFRLMAVGPGMSIELDRDTKATPEIFFQDIEFFPFRAIIPTLAQLAEDVRNVREAFLGLVGSRNQPQP